MQRMTRDQVRKEAEALGQVVSRLRRVFPELSEEEIQRAVHGTYLDFENAKIRDFVPVLVEHAVRNDLRATPQYRA